MAASPHDAERRRKRRNATVFLALLIGVPLVLLGVYRVTVGRPYLVGDVEHDFGRVTGAGEAVVLEHTFRLRNRLAEPLKIAGIRPSCGCIVPVLDSHDVPAGAEIEVPVTLTIERYGRKRETITILVDGRGARVLTLRAVVDRPDA